MSTRKLCGMLRRIAKTTYVEILSFQCVFGAISSQKISAWGIIHQNWLVCPAVSQKVQPKCNKYIVFNLNIYNIFIRYHLTSSNCPLKICWIFMFHPISLGHLGPPIGQGATAGAGTGAVSGDVLGPALAGGVLGPGALAALALAVAFAALAVAAAFMAAMPGDDGRG